MRDLSGARRLGDVTRDGLGRRAERFLDDGIVVAGERGAEIAVGVALNIVIEIGCLDAGIAATEVKEALERVRAKSRSNV